MRPILVLLSLVGGLTAAPPPEVAALQNHVKEVIKAAKPSVACVLVSRSDKYAAFGQGPSAAADGKLGDFRPPLTSRFDSPAQRDLVKRLDLANPETVPESYGSGVVIDDAGLVLTTYHVIAGATKVFVRLPGAGRGSYADVHAADERADLAVLRMLHPPVTLKAIAIGDGGKVEQGDFVVALANPFAAGFKDGEPSSSWVEIANTRRRSLPPAGKEVERIKPLSQYSTLLQTDGRIVVGCSGGALLNMDGELVGLTTATAAITGGAGAGGFAIPMDANTRRMIDVLKRGQEIEYGFLGVSVNPEDRSSDGRGVLITEVTPGMPAARASIARGDLIVGINGVPVREQDDLFYLISAAQADTDAEIEIDRHGRRIPPKKVRLTKSPLPANMTVIASNRPKPVFGLRVEYLSTVTASVPLPPEGVLVKDLEPGSPADKNKKLKDMMSAAQFLVVTAVDGKPVKIPADFYREAAGKRSVRLDLVEVGDRQKPDEVTLP
jgi:serine protease Do